jgi:hypothetical protein
MTSPLVSYKIYSSNTLVETVDATVLGYTYSSLTAGTSYLISISAMTAIGESELRSLATTMWAVDPAPATTISVTGASRDSCSVLWTPVVDPSGQLVTGYVILVDDGRDGHFRVAHDGSTNPSVFEAVITGLVPHMTYRITGYALNVAGPGVNATEITCFTATVPGVPGTPSLVTSSATSIQVTWTPAYDDGGSPIREYQLWMDEVEGIGPANVENWGTTAIYTGSLLSTTISAGLTATKAYRFKVKAVNEAHSLESPFSPVAAFYAAPLPAQVTFTTTGNAHLQLSRTWIFLDWDTPTISATELPVDSYVVYWDEGTRSSGNFTRLT